MERPSTMNVQQTLHDLTRRLQQAHDDVQDGFSPSPFPDSPLPSRAEVHAAVADVRRALEAFVPVWSAGDDEARVKASGAMREWSVAHSSCPYFEPWRLTLAGLDVAGRPTLPSSRPCPLFLPSAPPNPPPRPPSPSRPRLLYPHSSRSAPSDSDSKSTERRSSTTTTQAPRPARSCSS